MGGVRGGLVPLAGQAPPALRCIIYYYSYIYSIIFMFLFVLFLGLF